LAYFTVMSHHFHGRTEENHKHLQDDLCPYRAAKWLPPQQKSESLALTPTYFFRGHNKTERGLLLTVLFNRAVT